MSDHRLDFLITLVTAGLLIHNH